MSYQITEAMVEDFRKKLLYAEKSSATIEKYMRDLKSFCCYAGRQRVITKEIVMEYKQVLMQNYAPSSINSMLASINSFFKEVGWYDCIVKSLRIQRDAFRQQERELTKKEYYRLLEAAKKKKSFRLYYLMQTLCATGIRISELRFITVEALNTHQAKVSLKGKVRTVILPKALCRQLKRYIKEKKICSGPIFITRTGQPVDRSNICHEMKALSKMSGISRAKIFPHNLRHLFACVYYQAVKDLSHLADILGHSSINTTRIYTKVSSAVQSRQIDMLKLVI